MTRMEKITTVTTLALTFLAIVLSLFRWPILLASFGAAAIIVGGVGLLRRHKRAGELLAFVILSLAITAAVEFFVFAALAHAVDWD